MQQIELAQKDVMLKACAFSAARWHFTSAEIQEIRDRLKPSVNKSNFLRVIIIIIIVTE
jgi:hypothetical protein